MADLVVIVPSRGRPEAARELITAFTTTCTADTDLVFAVDADDPTLPQYRRVISEHTFVFDRPFGWRRNWMSLAVASGTPHTMVNALNEVASAAASAQPTPTAIAFLGDDHRPRSMGWDATYLETLRQRPGLVYGNDLIQGEKLPTQVAMSAEVVRALGHMAPPALTHMYVDNYWLQLGRDVDCITYLPDLVVEHMHPYAQKAPVDEGYLRVNSREMFARDEAASAAYWAEFGARDVAAVRAVLPIKSRP